MTLRERIDHNTSEFSPSDNQIATHFLANLEATLLLSGAELATQLETSPSSITRFAQRLGFEGYPDLRRALRRELREQQAPSVPTTKEGVFAAYWQREKQNLEELSRTSDILLERVCDVLATAKRVWIYQTGQFPEAIRTMKNIVRKYRDFPDVRAALSAALWHDGQTGEAESNWVAVIGLDSRYRDLDWVRNTRRWPPNMVAALEKFIKLQ